ncbi:MAG: aminoglycoside adenylyltransferase [Actinomycetia bacterium]|nr:aminoglycoside adenylyltransferase [Actinomycetes bacterium]
MSRQLAQIAEISAAATAARLALWLRGGWAMDFHLGEITRPHTDVDWFAWAFDAPALVALLGPLGYVPVAGPPPELQRDLAKDGVDHNIALLTRSGARIVVPAGPYAGEPWPDGMLDGPPATLHGVTCAIVAVRAQIEIKEQMPVWVPGLAHRPKDATDVARLRASIIAG